MFATLRGCEQIDIINCVCTKKCLLIYATTGRSTFSQCINYQIHTCKDREGRRIKRTSHSSHQAKWTDTMRTDSEYHMKYRSPKRRRDIERVDGRDATLKSRLRHAARSFQVKLTYKTYNKSLVEIWSGMKPQAEKCGQAYTITDSACRCSVVVWLKCATRIQMSKCDYLDDKLATDL